MFNVYESFIYLFSYFVQSLIFTNCSLNTFWEFAAEKYCFNVVNSCKFWASLFSYVMQVFPFTYIVRGHVPLSLSLLISWLSTVTMITPLRSQPDVPPPPHLYRPCHIQRTYLPAHQVSRSGPYFAKPYVYFVNYCLIWSVSLSCGPVHDIIKIWRGTWIWFVTTSWSKLKPCMRRYGSHWGGGVCHGSIRLFRIEGAVNKLKKKDLNGSRWHVVYLRVLSWALAILTVDMKPSGLCL